MTSKANTPDEYMAELPADRKDAVNRLRQLIRRYLKKDFEEKMSYGMIGYVIPRSIYPHGYHCDPKLPLPFISIASQKNFISLYHMGLYENGDLTKWLQQEWPNYSDKKLDMGKSCVRFKNPVAIPYQLIELLISKMSPRDWIKIYEENFKP